MKYIYKWNIYINDIYINKKRACKSWLLINVWFLHFGNIVTNSYSFSNCVWWGCCISFFLFLVLSGFLISSSIIQLCACDDIRAWQEFVSLLARTSTIHTYIDTFIDPFIGKPRRIENDMQQTHMLANTTAFLFSLPLRIYR